jgi:excisionase family DNA binding protein
MTAADYRAWLRKQLIELERLQSHPSPDLQLFDDAADVVREVGRRAAIAGVSAAVSLCDIRAGGLAPVTAREILAGCLAAIPRPQKERLTPPEVAKRYGVSPDTVRKWIADGDLVAVSIGSKGKRARSVVELSALEVFDKRRTAKASPPPSRRRILKTDLLVSRF